MNNFGRLPIRIACIRDRATEVAGSTNSSWMSSRMMNLLFPQCFVKKETTDFENLSSETKALVAKAMSRLQGLFSHKLMSSLQEFLSPRRRGISRMFGLTLQENPRSIVTKALEQRQVLGQDLFAGRSGHRICLRQQ